MELKQLKTSKRFFNNYDNIKDFINLEIDIFDPNFSIEKCIEQIKAIRESKELKALIKSNSIKAIKNSL